MPDALINGLEASRIAIGDRGLNYGDGLFETVAIDGGRPLLWERHMRRLQSGCRRLAIEAPCADLLEREASHLCRKRRRAVLKIIVTRGGGGRGYGPPRHPAATRILSVQPWPDYPRAHYETGVTVRVCRTRLATPHALAGLKHLNRLEQVLARAEWDDPRVAEGLMLDREDHVIEGTMSNIFMVRGDRLITPDLSGAGVAGIMRALIMELAPALALTPAVRPIALAELGTADEIFLSNSLMGLWPVRAVEGFRRLRPGPASRALAGRLADYRATPGPGQP